MLASALLRVIEHVAVRPGAVCGPGAAEARTVLAAAARALGARPHTGEWIESSAAVEDVAALPAERGFVLALTADALAESAARAQGARVLAPGGFLLTVTPGAAPVETSMDGPLVHRASRTAGGATLRLYRRPAAAARIALFTDGADATFQMRTLRPLEELEARGRAEFVMLERPPDPRDVAGADLLLVSRSAGPDSLAATLAAREFGVRVAFDLDDDFLHIPWFNPSRAQYDHPVGHMLHRALVAGSDTVLTAVPALHALYAPHHPHVLVQANLVDGAVLAPDWDRTEVDATTFVYNGTTTHSEDLRPLLGPLRRLLDERAGAVRAVFVGRLPEELRGAPHVRATGWIQNYWAAVKALARCGGNVGLAPLVDLPFNRVKSAVKFFDYGACGICTVASAVEPYLPYVRDGENGVLVREHTPAAWDRALTMLVDDPERRRRLARRAHADTTAYYTVAACADEFDATIRQLLDAPRRAWPGPARPWRECAVDAAPELSLVVRLPLARELALGAVHDLRTQCGYGTPLFVSGTEPLLHAIYASTGEAESRLVDADGPPPETDPVVAQLREVATKLALVIDAGVHVDRRTVVALAGALAPDVIAAGPRFAGVAPSRPQSAQAASRAPVEPWNALAPGCVLLQMDAVRRLGLADGLSWTDALFDLCARAAAAGLRTVVANQALAAPSGRVPRREPAGWRGASRARLAARLAARPADEEFVRAARAQDPVGTLGCGGERLAAWVVARAGSRSLDACLARLDACPGPPLELHVVHDGALETTLACERHAALPYVRGRDAAGSLLALARARGTTHALLLHDGVLLAPGALDELTSALLAPGVVLAAPSANDGASEQRVDADGPVDCARLDETVLPALAAYAGAVTQPALVAPFCVLVDVAALAALGPETWDAACRGDWRAVVAGGRARLARGAYAHVLSHPDEAVAAGVGTLPGAPLAVPVPDLPALLEVPRRTEPGLAQLDALRAFALAQRANPHGPRTLAALGWISLWRGELDRGMDLLDKARKADPFDPWIVDVLERARTLVPVFA